MAGEKNDAFVRSEVQQMRSFLVRTIGTINSEVIEHPEIRKRRNLSALALKATAALSTLYQAIGNDPSMTGK